MAFGDGGMVKPLRKGPAENCGARIHCGQIDTAMRYCIGGRSIGVDPLASVEGGVDIM
jgi:hypothetical protein